MSEKTEVLVVGGGLVGLSTAVFLAQKGAPTILCERHPGSSPHPRAIGFRTRTMEIYRSVGLGARIPQVPPGHRLRRIRVESLAGKWFEESGWSKEPEEPIADIERSPCTAAGLAQDRLEPILRDRAIELGADIRLETELLRFEQDAGGVTAWLRKKGGEEYEVRASYLVAADGHRSPVREALGIGRQGRGHMRTVRSVIFRAPAIAHYLERGIAQFSVEQPGFEAFLTTYRDGRWLLIFPDDEERDQAALEAAIKKAIGLEVAIEQVVTGRWEVSALIADRFAAGRIFLAGDAAHTLPPNRGGYGANTGIEDAHDLAWKLAAVTAGVSSPKLLESYDQERRPIAWLRHRQIFARPDFKGFAEGQPQEPIIDDIAMELGQLYRSSALLGAGSDLPPAARPEEWAGQPGTRAPHRWIERAGERLSTLDLFGGGWVLLSDDDRWAAGCEPLRIEFVRIEEDYRQALGLHRGGASLVRPDGYVGFRAIEMPDDPALTLREAFVQIASALAES